MSELQEEGRAEITSPARLPLAFLLIASIILVVDQVTKSLAVVFLVPSERVDLLGDLFGLRLVFNTGGAFGILEGAPVFFFVAGSVVVALVLWWGFKSAAPPVPLGLILGGGLGNLVDRVVRPPRPVFGEVVDFLDLSFWPTFNVADAAIVVGVALVMISGLRRPTQ